MLKAVQGYTFKKEINDASSQMVMFDGINKYVIDEIEIDGDKFSLIADANVTKDWIPRKIFISTIVR